MMHDCEVRPGMTTCSRNTPASVMLWVCSLPQMTAVAYPGRMLRVLNHPPPLLNNSYSSGSTMAHTVCLTFIIMASGSVGLASSYQLTYTPTGVKDGQRELVVWHGQTLAK